MFFEEFMTQDPFIYELAAGAKITIDQANALASAFGAIIQKALLKGEKVVYSNFGTFYLVHYPSKIITHPKKPDQKMVMLPTNVVKWMPSGNIKDLVNNEVEIENATAHGTRKKTINMPRKPKLTTEAEALPQVNSSESIEEEIPIKNVSSTPNIPIAEDQPASKQDGSIYEELMGDGSKVESTFKDAIRVHRDRTKYFFNKVLNRNSSPDVTNRENKVSLSGAGIFDNISSTPAKTQASEQSIALATKLEQAPSSPVTSTKTNVSNLPLAPEKEIIPFAPAKSQIIYTDLSKITVPKELLALLPEKIARKYKVVPISFENNQLTVAMADPEDIEAKEIIKKLTQKSIVPKLSSEEEIGHILDQYSGLESELSEAIKEGESEIKEVAPETMTVSESVSDNAPAARIVTSLLRRAIRDKASDIHIEPSEKEITIRFRIDGILQKSAQLPKEIQAAVTSRIKILSNLKIDEQRLPQDGRFSISFDDRKIDFRISTLPTSCGEKIVMRVLDKANGILTVEQLGLRGKGLDDLKIVLEKSNGMILVTGPTGSGKTTTLYALIDKLYSEGINIVTLEDPIEYRMPGINQSQVNTEIDYTFASGLRTIVRQDPDIIMIGEIRDGETAEMAVHAALTGHVVLSTLHTNDSAGAAPRLIDMGVEPFLLTSSINAVIGQRLGRKICEDCKEEVTLPEEEVIKIKAEIEKMSETEKSQIKNKEYKFFHGKGCKVCNNSGYKGRVGLFEILIISEKIKELILKKESSYKIEEQAISEGMITMLHDGLLKVLDGVTTIEEVWRTTKE